MDYADSIADGIRARLNELQNESAALTTALAALEGTTSYTPHVTIEQTTVTADQVYNALRGGIDHAPTAAEFLQTPLATVRARLLMLEKEGRVKRTGSRRNTRWQAIPNEGSPEPNALPEPSVETPPKQGRARKTELPPVERPTTSHNKPAAVDDVLALVVHGMSRTNAIAEQLGVTAHSVNKRLHELMNEGMVAKQGPDWSATPAAEQNWTEHRAREIAESGQQPLTVVA